MSSKKVWITGVGTANPLGTDYQTTAENLLKGASGIGPITDFSLPDHLSKVAGRVKEIPTPTGWEKEDFARLTKLEQLLLWCSTQALQSAGLWDRRHDISIGAVFGLGAEFMYLWEVDRQHGGNRVGEPARDGESTLEMVQRSLGLNGPATTVAAACASGNYALAQARKWIHMGWVDVCLAGAGDMFVTPMAMTCFGNLRALSRRNSDPQGASRPFDRDRDGFVMGEGGVVFTLETEEHARRRGISPLGEFAGFGASSDAYHMVIPSPEREPAIQAMRRALDDARIHPDDIDYLNAHATSTPVGDTAESQVISAIFGPNVERVPVSSTKSMTGHLLSGAAAMNVLACLVALERQALPPTINLYDPDPECNLCHVPLQAREQKARIVISNSLGFGGSNTSVVLRKVA